MTGPADIRSVSVLLTSQCNLRCGYCYQDKKPDRMSWDTLRRSVDLAFRSKRAEVEIQFYGGEPLLEYSLLRRAVEYAESVCPPARRVRFEIVTNGTLLDETRLEYLVAHGFRLLLSFDGVPAAQELRGRGTHAPLHDLLCGLRERRPAYLAENVQVSMVLQPKTIGVLADSVEYFLRQGVSRIGIGPCLTPVTGWDEDHREALDAQFARIYASNLRAYRLTGSIPVRTLSGGRTSARRPKTLSMCGVMRGEYPAVDVDGQVNGCVMFSESVQKYGTRFLRPRFEDMRIGDVRSEKLEADYAAFPAAVERARIFHDKQDKFSSYRACGDCEYLADCGICPVSIGYLPGNEDPRRIPDFLCAFNLVSLRYRDRLAREIEKGKIRLEPWEIPPRMNRLGRLARRLSAKA